MTESFDIVQPEDILAFDQTDDENAGFVKKILDHLKMPYLNRSEDIIECFINKLPLVEKAQELIQDGMPCHLITPRKQGHIQGKVKLVLQFIANEDIDTNLLISSENQTSIVDENDCKSVIYFESPLDEIRNSSI